MKSYRGRFAPSPSGPLHFGSLIAAVASFLEARCRGGDWLVRIEDLDPPRVVPGAADAILRTLERYGMNWDGPVLYQSARREHYQAALERLEEEALVYPCICSRRTLAAAGGPIYPGTCRDGRGRSRRLGSIRLRVDGAVVGFEDRVQGRCVQDLAAEVGDFVIRRADGCFAYQLAVVVDDAAQTVTEVVRGSDLLDSTPRQMYLQQRLGLPTPRYAHLPVAVDRGGHKLSKQTRAAPLDLRRPGPALVAALRFLGQDPPPSLVRERPAAIWSWALANWAPKRIAPVLTLPCPFTPNPVTRYESPTAIPSREDHHERAGPDRG